MSFWTKARDAVVSFVSGPAWDFIRPFWQLLIGRGGSILISAAENAVAAGFAAGGNSEARMLAALGSFSAEVVAKGLPFVESQARLFIETALQKAKNALPGS